MKRDLKLLTLAADNLLKTLEAPRHRAIMENYRLHAMLEVSGRWSEIFAPDMTVETPFYRIATPQGVLELNGAAAVQSFYKGLIAGDATVMILEHESIVVSDWGFSSEALYHTYLTGDAALARGHASADPAKKYIEARWVCMTWPYDEAARMIGERVYPAPTTTLNECAEADFVTLEDAHATFAPLIDAAQAAMRARKAA